MARRENASTPLPFTRTQRAALPSSPVTAEPLPSRLAAIARGTGEVDCVYHIGFEELVAETDAAGTAERKKALDELITQNREDFLRLSAVLAV